jgi:hypothetical protein
LAEVLTVVVSVALLLVVTGSSVLEATTAVLDIIPVVPEFTKSVKATDELVPLLIPAREQTTRPVFKAQVQPVPEKDW